MASDGPTTASVLARAGKLVGVLISHRHRFVFLRTRKTAGSSVETALARYAGPEDVVTLRGQPRNTKVPLKNWQPADWVRAAMGRPMHFHTHMPASHVRNYIRWADYYSFTTDRNPWDLSVSAYHWYRERVRIGKASNPPILTTFDEFVMSDRLATFSSWKIYAIDDRIVVNTVVRYDRLEEELSKVTDGLGLPKLSLPHAKGSIRIDRRPYQEWYTGETRERVAEVFHREIGHFGWTFDYDGTV